MDDHGSCTGALAAQLSLQANREERRGNKQIAHDLYKEAARLYREDGNSTRSDYNTQKKRDLEPPFRYLGHP